MEITRSFVPVGQGGFCVERFVWGDGPEEKATVVYDCGSITLDNEKKIVTINEEFKIEENNDEPPVIDALFISHFHWDHINMLFYLAEVCSIKKIILPYINSWHKKILLLKLFLNKNIKENEMSLARAFIESYNVPGENNTEFILVAADANDFQSAREITQKKNFRIIDSGKKSAEEIMKKDKHQLLMDWCFEFHNLFEKERTEMFIDKLKKELELDILKEEIDYIMLISDSSLIESVRKVYNSIDGDLNVNSLVLYSGLDVEKSNDVNFHIAEEKECFEPQLEECRNGDKCQTCNNHCDDNREGCLYLGDFDLKKNMSKISDLYIKKYKDHIGCVQIPHHGSRKSFNKEIILSKDIVYIIIAGSTNPYKHPHNEVISNFLSCRNIRNKLRIVTEDKNTAVKFKLNLNE